MAEPTATMMDFEYLPAPAVLDDIAMQGDYSLLDGTANLDDWAFLGTDTAFFKSLVRGAGDMPIDDAEFLTRCVVY